MWRVWLLEYNVRIVVVAVVSSCAQPPGFLFRRRMFVLESFGHESRETKMLAGLPRVSCCGTDGDRSESDV